MDNNALLSNLDNLQSPIALSLYSHQCNYGPPCQVQGLYKSELYHAWILHKIQDMHSIGPNQTIVQTLKGSRVYINLLTQSDFIYYSLN